MRTVSLRKTVAESTTGQHGKGSFPPGPPQAGAARRPDRGVALRDVTAVNRVFSMPVMMSANEPYVFEIVGSPIVTDNRCTLLLYFAARHHKCPQPGSGERLLPAVISVELRGLEPLTPSLRTRCATSCATAPWCGRNDNTATGPRPNPVQSAVMAATNGHFGDGRHEHR